jgi:hypothetical protein
MSSLDVGDPYTESTQESIFPIESSPADAQGGVIGARPLTSPTSRTP